MMLAKTSMSKTETHLVKLLKHALLKRDRRSFGLVSAKLSATLRFFLGWKRVRRMALHFNFAAGRGLVGEDKL